MKEFEAGCSEVCSLHLVEEFFLINQPATMVQESMELMVRKSLQLRAAIFMSAFQISLDANLGLQDKPADTSLSVPCCL